MSSNAITGSIPGSWSDGFHSLQMLDLHGNQLSGALPDSFGTAGALSSLNNLVLNNNQFSGARARACLRLTCACKNRPASDACDCALIGVPAVDGRTCLVVAGALPSTWGTAGAFSSLQVLDVGYNQLDGALPPAWGASGVLTSLNQLNLAGNQFAGTIPTSWGAQGSLQALSQL